MRRAYFNRFLEYTNHSLQCGYAVPTKLVYCLTSDNQSALVLVEFVQESQVFQGHSVKIYEPIGIRVNLRHHNLRAQPAVIPLNDRKIYQKRYRMQQLSSGIDQATWNYFLHATPSHAVRLHKATPSPLWDIDCVPTKGQRYQIFAIDKMLIQRFTRSSIPLIR